MPIKDQKELFIWMLSDLRQGAERSTKIFQELAQIAQDPDSKGSPGCTGLHLRQDPEYAGRVF